MKKKQWTPEGGYVQIRLELLQSPAWAEAPRPLKAMLEVFTVAHLQHAGAANGELFVSYTTLVRHGFSRGNINMLVEMGVALGLLKVVKDTGTGQGILRDGCKYTLTYFPTGIARDIAPTDEWKRVKTVEQAQAIIERVRDKKQKKQTARKARRMSEAA